MNIKVLSFGLGMIIFFGGCAHKITNTQVRQLSVTGGVIVGSIVGGESGAKYGGFVGAIVGGMVGKLIGDEIVKRREKIAQIARQEKIKIVYKNVTIRDIGEKQQRKNIKKNNKDNHQSDEKIIGDKVVVNINRQFSKNSFELTEQARKVFFKIGQLYKNNGKKILIIGHTDDGGSKEYNRILSEKRAFAVGKVFKEAGVEEKNIYYLGVGAGLPIADNNLKDGRIKNRRVEIVELESADMIASFVRSRKANPEFFRKRVVKIVKYNTKTTPVHKRATRTKKSRISTPAGTKNDTSGKKLYVKSDKDIKTSGKFLLFKGKPVTINSMALLKEFGDPVKKSFLSFVSYAYAGKNPDSVYISCIYDKPQGKSLVQGKIKSLDSKESIPIYQFEPGLYETSWYFKKGKNIFGITPVGVLKNGGVTVYPKILLYDDKNRLKFKEESVKVDTYKGTKGILYRVFVKNSKSPLQCIDIVFNYGSAKAKGIVYFLSGGKSYQSEIVLKQLKLKKGI